MNRVQHLFVAKDVAASGTEGFIRFVTPDGTAITPGETIADHPVIHLEQDLANSEKVTSPPIEGAYVKRWKGTANAAAVAQVTYVGDNSSTGDIVDSNSTEYVMYITLNSDKDTKTVPWSYRYVSDASATAAEIATAFITAVNSSLMLNNDSTQITAASETGGGNQGIKLTGGTGTKATYFTVALGGGFTTTPITYTTKYDPGVGNHPWTTTLENAVLGNRGFFNQRVGWETADKFVTAPKYIVAAEGYDIYALEFGRSHDEQYINGTKVAPVQLFIAVPAGPSSFPQSTFESIINPWIASTPIAASAVSL
jgi:hypothetical protein